MKKLIDIPEEIVKDLKKMAINAYKDIKNFIQDIRSVFIIIIAAARKLRYFRITCIYKTPVFQQCDF